MPNVAKIESLGHGLFRILVPFEDLTTTVYVIKGESGSAVIDCATFSSDVDEYILPALKNIGIDASDVKHILLSHSHTDHCGGIRRMSECLTNVDIHASFELDIQRYHRLMNGELILERLQAVLLPGHTDNSFGFFDIYTSSLLSADCLQLKGVGLYRKGIAYPELYRSSINMLRNMPIRRIVAAHEYDPLGSIADGESAVNRYLDLCLDTCPS